ncbi:uncharacterized protein LOC114240302 [Bombyx mandarina]|uniref:Uncharacterized protein LOC114240302 n=1 Tax=Bombyx mandarina TaxID=7092 RepID=A0A6J2JB18_BOMMA|nr:uncharacterized protein LOC114240302 [Bombyx mandarina]
MAISYMILAAQFSRFVKAPIVMNVEKDYFNWNVSYPAIILCPVNKIQDEALSSIVNETLDQTGLNVESYLRTIVSMSLDTLQLLQIPNQEILSLIDPGEYPSISLKLFKKFDESILSTVTKWPIPVEDTMTEIGMCHFINSNVASLDNPSKWYDTTSKYSKTNIELSYHDRDFFVQVVNYADEYKIYTTSPDDVIMSEASSLKFELEGFLSFGVQITSTRASNELRNVPLHLRKCRFTDEPHSNRYAVYSYNRCIIECRIKMITRLCGCVPHFYKKIENERICSLPELRCIVLYKREITTLTASNETLQRFNDYTDLPRTSRDCGCLGDCEADVYQQDPASLLPQESLNRLRISVTSFPKVRFMREIMFSTYDIILRSGGIVNLCIGTSFISIMELMLTAIRLPIYEIANIAQACRNAKTADAQKVNNKKLK